MHQKKKEKEKTKDPVFSSARGLDTKFSRWRDDIADLGIQVECIDCPRI